MSGVVLNLLSAGAAQGLVKALQPAFETQSGMALQGRFGAVGFIKDALLAGEPCDLLVLTAALIDQLTAQGLLRPGTRADIGPVPTSVAVQAGQPRPDVSTPAALRAALLGATALYCPDTVKSTAGQHVARVLQDLGVADDLRPRLREFPNGATAMREMAASADRGVLGCTQATEIMHTVGVELVADLPPPHGLLTVYAGAVALRAAQPEAAAQLLALLTGPASLALRREGGFQA